MPWLTSTQIDVGYIGWIDRGNVGDDLMHRAHQRILKPTRVRPVPLSRAGLTALSWRTARADTLLLGGGTLVGLDAWADRVERILKTIPHKRFVIYGPGVEDRDFGLARGATTPAGLEKWKELLAKADFIGVRGPRSVQELHAISVESVVVGDPALCVPLQRTSGPVTGRPMVSVNLTGVSSSLPRSARWRTAIAQTVATLQSEGYGVAVFGMDVGDVRATLSLLADFSCEPDIVVSPRNARRVVGLLQASSLVFAERLHGAILAANLEVPFLHLGYRPKSFDFIESIHAADYVIGEGEADADEILERVTAFANAGFNPKVSEHISDLRRGFVELYRENVHQ